MTFKSDIDIDFPDREKVLSLLKHNTASIKQGDELTKHNTGVYFSDIPVDQLTSLASIDYVEAEERGYVKLDLLNVHVYGMVRDETHLLELMHMKPNWNKLKSREFFEQIIHIGNHYDLMLQMPEPIDSLTRMAMFLAIIRPGKRHLAGKTWAEVAKTVWERDNEGYTFKKAHGIAYSHLVVVHMNLLSTQPSESA